MKMYEIQNISKEYPEDFDYRYNYLNAVINNIISSLVAELLPISWILGGGNETEIFNLIVETESYKSRLANSDLAQLNMLKAALITHKEVYRAKFQLLGISI